ncbi:dethiobiotin synthase [Polaromonas naphthalenivorans]|uniref:ATP-dependent dethiobiotin synthetase BioD n=1 Tax=Polaromonas naphthalenivorans (strain CJ2) TaxID=365044 RepID=A1VUJ5_POLNA|nr:dethiobiotin synthase [Polaromonas naphthalenivorans]ABM39323.1 dethiobiotin synthase [Polaromonas naphthalenivorans CJ2]
MTLAPALHGCFITGTDTDIGKTCISAALLHWCAQQGWRSAGLKPVAAGTALIDGQRINDDVQALRQAGSVPLTDAEVGPLQFEAACAPHIAAALENRRIDGPGLVRHAQALASRTDVLVVEGVGGFCVPLDDAWDTADLAVALGLPVILVVGLRLGCINHALLTAEAIQSRGLALAGWIANTIDPSMAHSEGNLASLRHELMRRHQAPCLGVVPRLAVPGPAYIAAHLDSAALAKLLSPR